jgi:hypothetical protein
MAPRHLISAALAVIVAAFALAQVPFSEPPPGQPATPLPSLSDIMEKSQFRHIKIWHAIKSDNWDLLDYEVGQARDILASAGLFYRNLPVEYVVAAGKPLNALQDAARARDGSKLKPAFDELTAACNSCHKAAQVGFIVIQTPTESPFSNQDFRPKH